MAHACNFSYVSVNNFWLKIKGALKSERDGRRRDASLFGSLLQVFILNLLVKMSNHSVVGPKDTLSNELRQKQEDRE